METCSAIWDQLLQARHLNCPKSKDEWKRVAVDFDYCWNFPNSFGAIDGKHVTIQCPAPGGSMFYNYKKYNSINLMAVVKASYQFIMVDIGDYGRLSGGSTFGSVHLSVAIINNQLNLPEPRLVGNRILNYDFLGMMPFP